jgi:hypothetical protein
MESALGAASHFSSDHLTLGSLHRFFILNHVLATLHLAQSPPDKQANHVPKHLAKHVNKLYQRPSGSPRSTQPPSAPPPHWHSTDLTGARFCLHWKKKQFLTNLGLVRSECISEWIRMSKTDITLPQCGCSAHRWKRKTKYCLPLHVVLKFRYRYWVIL